MSAQVRPQGAQVRFPAPGRPDARPARGPPTGGLHAPPAESSGCVQSRPVPAYSQETGRRGRDRPLRESRQGWRSCRSGLPAQVSGCPLRPRRSGRRRASRQRVCTRQRAPTAANCRSLHTMRGTPRPSGRNRCTRGCRTPRPRPRTAPRARLRTMPQPRSPSGDAGSRSSTRLRRAVSSP